MTSHLLTFVNKDLHTAEHSLIARHNSMTDN